MPVCNNCEAFVTHDFARVFGDNKATVTGCLECMAIGEFVSRDGVDARRAEAMLPVATIR